MYIYISIYIHIFQGFPQVLRTWGAANLLKMNVFTHIVLFLGIMLWKGASHFNGKVCFSDGGVSFLIGGGHLMEGIIFDGGGGFGKIMDEWRSPPCPPSTGKPVFENIKWMYKEY